MADLSVEYRTIAELIPYARNPRTHSDVQVAQIAASIREFGWTNPVLVDGENGVIAGHGRLMAARKLGMETVPVIELAHLSDAQKQAYVIADNQHALNGGWNSDLLSAGIKDLRELAFDLSTLGFSDRELEKLLLSDDRTEQDHQEQVDDVSVPEGSIWQLDRHYLMCGDCRDQAAIEKLVGGQRPDLLFFDPPFEDESAWRIDLPQTSKAFVFSGFWCIRDAMHVLERYAHVYEFIWDHGQSHYRPHMPLARHKTAFYCAQERGWNYDRAIYRSEGKDRKARRVSATSNGQNGHDYMPLPDGLSRLATVFQHGKTGDPEVAGHSKPVQWVKALLAGADARVIFDPMAGSAVSIRAAHEDMTVYAMEIDGKACAAAIARWQAATGMEARRLDADRPRQATVATDGRRAEPHPSREGRGSEHPGASGHARR